jgi:hypothetical protein
MTPRVLIQFLFAVLLATTCGLAVRLGGGSERAGALIIVSGALLTFLMERAAPIRWHGVERNIFLIDVAMLIAFMVLTIASHRFWPIWTTAFQLLTVASHLGPLFRPVHNAMSFAFDEQVWSWVILVQLGFVSILRRVRSPS